MRMLLIALFAFGAFAQAAEMECEYPTGNNRYATTKMDFYPLMLVEFGTKTCIGGGSSKFCTERGEERMVTPDAVCGYRVDQRWDCRTREWNDGRGNYFAETNCPRRGVTAEVHIDRRGEGTLSCYSGNRPARRWHLGACKYGRR